MKCWLLLVVLTFAVLPAWATARDGTCDSGNAVANNCTFTNITANDLKIVLAWDEGGIIPTVPSGWTSISSEAGGAGCCGWNFGCEVATSGSDNGSGSWTNATLVVGIAFSGTAGTTANCLLGIGGNAFAGPPGGVQTDFTVLGITMTQPDWVAAFGANANQVICTPTGLTKVASGGTASNFSIALDTEAPVGSWSTVTCSNVGVSWTSVVAEIINVTGSQGVSKLGITLNKGSVVIK